MVYPLPMANALPGVTPGAPGSGGIPAPAPTWKLVLLAGNYSGGKNAVLTSGDQLQGEDAAAKSGLAGGAAVVRGGQGDGAGIDGPIVLLLRDAATGGAVQADQGGNARGLNAIDLQVHRTAATQVASGSRSIILGGQRNTASGINTVVGGYSNLASSNFGTVLGGYNNTASTKNAATVLGGHHNSATGLVSTAVGGNNNTASGTRATVVGGLYNSASKDSSATVGGTGNIASGTNAVAMGFYGTASGIDSFVGGGYKGQATSTAAATLGGYSNVASGPGAVALGGNTSTASGKYSAVGGWKNTASGANAVVLGGYNGTASGAYSSMIGGYNSTVSGKWSGLFASFASSASGNQAVVLGGEYNHARAFLSAVTGGQSAVADNIGQIAHGSGRADPLATSAGNPLFGQTQTDQFDVQIKTTNAAATVLVTGEVGGTTGLPILRPSTGWQFEAFIQASRITSAGGIQVVGDFACWTATGAIKRDGAGNTVLVAAATITPGPLDAGAVGWAVTVTADNVNEALQITGQGDVGSDIYWHATIWVSEAGVGVV